jgi:hypothetical protein
MTGYVSRVFWFKIPYSNRDILTGKEGFYGKAVN